MTLVSVNVVEVVVVQQALPDLLHLASRNECFGKLLAILTMSRHHHHLVNDSRTSDCNCFLHDESSPGSGRSLSPRDQSASCSDDQSLAIENRMDTLPHSTD